MFSLEDIIARNAAIGQAPIPPFDLRYHPRIVALTRDVGGMSVSEDYRRWLHRSIRQYAGQIVARVPGEGWDDLEALQQVALSDWMELVLIPAAWRKNAPAVAGLPQLPP